MSYQAPFVDAATSVDPVNRENMFISYYSYGSILGLALDLSLRQNKLNLDDYMKLVWQTYGKNEKPYTVNDLHQTLKKYAGNEFGDTFFSKYISKSQMPDYKTLLASVGVDLIQDGAPYFGASVNANNDGSVTIKRNTSIGSPAYKAGLDRDHIITAINGVILSIDKTFDASMAEYKVGDKLKVTYIAFGETRTTEVELAASPTYVTQMAEKTGAKVDKKTLERRNDWLN
jgi:predicted metalloprotease with PDZ domain